MCKSNATILTVQEKINIFLSKDDNLTSVNKNTLFPGLCLQLTDIILTPESGVMEISADDGEKKHRQRRWRVTDLRRIKTDT